MLLETVDALNFRNLQGGIDLAPGLNIMAGENGQGKTNWLEAIAVLADARSFRTARLNDAISFEKDEAMVRGNVRESAGIIRELQVFIKGSSKTMFVNGKKEPATR